MSRKPELSAIQLVASGLATVTATIGASFLGVAGTLLGATFMSVASTAGVAIYKHYLERTREQLRERTAAGRHTERAQAAAADATSDDPTRTVVWPGGLHADDPASVMSGVQSPEGSPRPEAAKPMLEWLKQRWLLLAVSSAAVFVVVMGSITLMEALTGKPASAWVGATDKSGTTLGGTKNTRSPSNPATTPPADEQTTEAPTADPTSPGQQLQPTTPAPPVIPTQQPTSQPTGSPAPQESAAPAPAPSGG